MAKRFLPPGTPAADDPLWRQRYPGLLDELRRAQERLELAMHFAYEEDFFRGCHDPGGGMLDEAVRRQILSYMAQPSDIGWQDVRSYVIATGAVLENVFDFHSPMEGSHPTAQELAAAMRHFMPRLLARTGKMIARLDHQQWSDMHH